MSTAPITSAACEAIITEVTNAIQALPAKLGSITSNTPWTRALKQSISDLGHKHNYKVCTSGVDGCDGEWLYDMVWYQNNKTSGYLEEVFLVMESEWALDFGDIKYDFEKLLLANAPLKVMVFQAWDEFINECFMRLEAGINTFCHRGSDEVYLLAGFNLNTRVFVVRRLPSFS